MLKISISSLLALVLLSLTGISQQTSAPALGESDINYRADLGRTGLYEYAAMRELPAVKWQVNIGSTSLGSPVYADGAIYMGTFTGNGSVGNINAYDAQTGQRLWSATGLGGHVAAVAVSGDFLYVGGASSKLLALDRRTGSQVWSFSVSGVIWNAPLVVADTVFVVSERAAYALDALTGAERWSLSPGQHQGFFGPPAFVDGLLYFSLRGIVFAVNAETGEITWQKPLDEFCYSLAVADGKVFIGCDDGYFYALNAETGEQLWRYGPRGTGWSAPAIANGKIYVGNFNRNIYSLDADTGDELWFFLAADAAVSDPLISDGVLYVGVGNHQCIEGRRHLYALDGETGDELWKFQAAGRVLTAPTLSEGVIYLVAFTGQMYALE